MKKYLLKLSTFASLPLLSLAAISCSNNQNIPPVDYEMINAETKGLAFNSNGEITKFYNYGGSTDINLEIPDKLINNAIETSEYYGYEQRITEIGNGAFSTRSTMNDQYQWAQYLNSVVLPNSIESIGAYAFDGTPLKEIVIPDSVINIYGGAFENCTNLTSVTLSKNIKCIWTGAFQYSALSSIIIPDSVSYIRSNAFYNTKLSGFLNIPDSVIKIYSGAFEGTQITEVSIPKSCEYEQDSFPSGCKVTVR